MVNVTTIQSESFNNNIAKHIISKRVNLAYRFSYKAIYLLAVIQYNKGQSISLIFKEANVKVPYYGWKIQLERRHEVLARANRVIESGYKRNKQRYFADQDYGDEREATHVDDKSEEEMIRLKNEYYDKLRLWQADRIEIERRTNDQDPYGEWMSKRKSLITGS